VNDPERQNHLITLRNLMSSELKEKADPRILGKGHLFDEYPVAFENIRNFYDRYMNDEPLKAPWSNSLAESGRVIVFSE
jgi:hypothetical protein